MCIVFARNRLVTDELVGKGRNISIHGTALMDNFS